MSAMQPISPKWQSNQRGSAGASAALTVSGQTKQLRILNRDTAGTLYIRTWNSAATQSVIAATNADMEFPAGVVEVITKPQDDNRVSVYSDTSALYSIMEGEGW